MKIKTLIPAEYIEQVLEMSGDVFDKDEELNFLKSCMFENKIRVSSVRLIGPHRSKGRHSPSDACCTGCSC